MAKITQNILEYGDRKAAAGECALGVRYMLDAMKIPNGKGHAYQYLDRLENSSDDWQRVEAVSYGGRELSMNDLQNLSRSELQEVLSKSPDVPPGAVIVYDRNNPPGETGGAKYGHVEIAVDKENGQRIFASDKARYRPGGTVPQNITAIFVHPDLGGEDVRGDIVNAVSQDMKDRIRDRLAGSARRPALTEEIADNEIPNLSELDPRLAELIQQLAVLALASVMSLFNSAVSEEAPREVPNIAGHWSRSAPPDIPQDIPQAEGPVASGSPTSGTGAEEHGGFEAGHEGVSASRPETAAPSEIYSYPSM